MFWYSFVAILTFQASSVVGHPGANHEHELVARREYLESQGANLAHCASALEARGISRRSMERRAAIARSLHEEMHLAGRAEYQSPLIDLSVFRSNASCVLSPEEILGPYFVAGEYVREDVREKQEGVPFILDVQFIDSKTCHPVGGKWVELWGANATGVYGGVVEQENGNGAADPGNAYNTWLRGVQQTDLDGVVQFKTIFPGHYHGRTNHLHVLLHPNAQPLPNGTLLSTTASYVGQLYFPQELNNEVRETAPYNTNNQPVTSNLEDVLLQGDLQQGGNPIVDYRLITSDVGGGVIGWLTYGINITKQKKVKPNRTYGPHPSQTI